MLSLIQRGRQERFSWLVQAIQHPGRPLRLLDVGGEWTYWRDMPWQQLLPVEITLLNLYKQTVCPPFTAVVGDGRDLSRYADRSFDVVYSHSVIGHVGDWTDQQRMARELQRVGRLVVLQTPNHYFPIDWQTMMPGFHFLPFEAQQWCLDRFRVGICPKGFTVDHARNLTRRELRMLFPAARLRRERIAGFTKSFVVIHRDGTI